MRHGCRRSIRPRWTATVRGASRGTASATRNSKQRDGERGNSNENRRPQVDFASFSPAPRLRRRNRPNPPCPPAQLLAENAETRRTATHTQPAAGDGLELPTESILRCSITAMGRRRTCLAGEQSIAAFDIADPHLCPSSRGTSRPRRAAGLPFRAGIQRRRAASVRLAGLDHRSSGHKKWGTAWIESPSTALKKGPAGSGAGDPHTACRRLTAGKRRARDLGCAAGGQGDPSCTQDPPHALEAGPARSCW